MCLVFVQFWIVLVCWDLLVAFLQVWGYRDRMYEGIMALAIYTSLLAISLNHCMKRKHGNKYIALHIPKTRVMEHDKCVFAHQMQ